jgi:hypothetical protein
LVLENPWRYQTINGTLLFDVESLRNKHKVEKKVPEPKTRVERKIALEDDD